MVTALAFVAVLAVLVLTAFIATREGPVMAEASPDAADLALPDRPMAPDDVHRVRFALAPRGYKMAEVDETLARLARELAERDRRLALLEAGLEGAEAPAPPDVREASAADLSLAAPPDVREARAADLGADVHEAGAADLPLAAPPERSPEGSGDRA